MVEDKPGNDEQLPGEPGDEQAPVDATPEEAAAAQAVPLPDDVAAEQAADEQGAEPTPEVEPDVEPDAEPAPEPEAEPGPEPPPAAEAEPEPADEEPVTPREKPAIPGADLELDLVLEGERREGDQYGYEEDGEPEAQADEEEADVVEVQPVAASIDLAAGARYRATGKRKTSVARVTLRPGSGAYTVNGKPLDAYFPRSTLQRLIRQPLEAVAYEDRMDVVARLHGGGVSAQAGALRHGISRALIEADPNLRGELKRRGFLTRDARVKERKKAGLKKARKRPQFSKR